LGICSPILANIYLHELDKFMEEMKEDFDQGLKRRGHPPYHALSREIRQLRQQVDALGSKSAEAQELKNRIKELDRQRKTMPRPAACRKTLIVASLNV